jgi:hypothetical protein
MSYMHHISKAKVLEAKIETPEFRFINSSFFW